MSNAPAAIHPSFFLVQRRWTLNAERLIAMPIRSAELPCKYMRRMMVSSSTVYGGRGAVVAAGCWAGVEEIGGGVLKAA